MGNPRVKTRAQPDSTILLLFRMLANTSTMSCSAHAQHSLLIIIKFKVSSSAAGGTFYDRGPLYVLYLAWSKGFDHYHAPWVCTINSLGMVRFGSVWFFKGFWRTLNWTIGSVYWLCRTLDRTIGSVKNGQVQVLKWSKPWAGPKYILTGEKQTFYLLIEWIHQLYIQLSINEFR